MASVCLTVCALFLFLPLAKQESVDKDLQLVMNAVGNIIDFYEKDYQNLNLDGLFGLRVLEGHLEALIKKHGSGGLQHLDTSVITKLKGMKEKATKTCNLSLVHVKKDKNYFRQIGYVVNEPWSLFDDYRRRVNITYAWPKATYMTAKGTVTVDEQVSDKCMSELIGSHKTNGKACDISSQCAHMMTAPGLLGYGITHQILWTMLAEKAGCRGKLQARLFELGRGDLTTLRLEFCTNNYIQLQETVKKFPTGLIPAIQDLFLEQMFVCPSLGYFEFLEQDFLSQILSWQYKNGCYGKMRRANVKVSFDPEIVGDSENDYLDEEEIDKAEKEDTLMKDKNAVAANVNNRKSQNQEGAVWEMSKNKGRKLLVEKTMSGGCLAHKTAVASGALAMYLRYLCEPNTEKLLSNKRKLGIVEPPPLGNDENEVKPAINKAGQSGGDTYIDKKDDVLNGAQNAHVDDGGGGFEKLKMNLNRESELVNPLNKLNKFHSAFEEYKNKVNIDKDKILDPKLTNEGANKQDLNINKQAKGEDKIIANNDPQKDDDNYDYKYDDNNDDGEDDDEDDDNDDEDGEFDEEYPDDAAINQRINQYYDNEDDADLKPLEDDNDNPDDDDDDDYNADDGYNDGYDDNDQENVHPHINARNIGRGASPDYDKEGIDDDNKLKEVRDYDDEDGDDYEYDDKNDAEMNKEDEIKDEFILAKPDNKAIDSRQLAKTSEHISEQSVLSTTTYIIFAISLVILIILYRFIRKRRIRLRTGHKYFHV